MKRHLRMVSYLAACSHINFLGDQVRRVWTGLTTWTMSTGRRVRQTGRISVLLASLGWEASWWSFFHCDFKHFPQLGGIGLATLGTIFASAMFGALMAPVVSGAFSRFQFKIVISQIGILRIPSAHPSSVHLKSQSIEWPNSFTSSECSCLTCNTPACRTRSQTQNLNCQSCPSEHSDMVTIYILIKAYKTWLANHIYIFISL